MQYQFSKSWISETDRFKYLRKSINKAELNEFRAAQCCDIQQISEKILDRPATFIVFDIETNGFNPRNHRTIEIGFRDLYGGTDSTFQTLINPGQAVKNVNIHGTTSSMVNRHGVPNRNNCLGVHLIICSTMKKSPYPKLHYSIPEDALIEILSKLPLKSLHKFKWVSKPWCSLISHHVLLKIPRSPLLGFFCFSINGFRYRPLLAPSANMSNSVSTSFDQNLSFLASPLWSELWIIDCCNGLVLCHFNKPDLEEFSDTYFVCNPTSKSWTMLSFEDQDYHCCKLDFNPWVSPHYKLVTLNLVNRRKSKITLALIRIYRSDRRIWEKKKINAGVDEVYDISDRIRHSALCNGMLYVYACCWSYSKFESHDFSEEDYKAMRFGPLEGEHINHQFIEFPFGTTKPSVATCFLGNSGNKLRFADLDGVEFRVWTLQGKHEDGWMMEHTNVINSLRAYESEERPQIVGFHPLLDAVVFIGVKSVLLAYDIKTMRLNEIHRIGSEAHEFSWWSSFPFSPCSLDLLETRKEL